MNFVASAAASQVSDLGGNDDLLSSAAELFPPPAAASAAENLPIPPSIQNTTSDDSPVSVLGGNEGLLSYNTTTSSNTRTDNPPIPGERDTTPLLSQALDAEYTGPGTPLLSFLRDRVKPRNWEDLLSMRHDIEYRTCVSDKCRNKADWDMLKYMIDPRTAIPGVTQDLRDQVGRRLTNLVTGQTVKNLTGSHSDGKFVQRLASSLPSPELKFFQSAAPIVGMGLKNIVNGLTSIIPGLKKFFRPLDFMDREKNRDWMVTNPDAYNELKHFGEYLDDQLHEYGPAGAYERYDQLIEPRLMQIPDSAYDNIRTPTEGAYSRLTREERQKVMAGTLYAPHYKWNSSAQQYVDMRKEDDISRQFMDDDDIPPYLEWDMKQNRYVDTRTTYDPNDPFDKNMPPYMRWDRAENKWVDLRQDGEDDISDSTIHSEMARKHLSQADVSFDRGNYVVSTQSTSSNPTQIYEMKRQLAEQYGVPINSIDVVGN